MPDLEREDWDVDYPIDPVPLTGNGATFIPAEDFTYDHREFFYRRFPYTGEITLDILGGGDAGLRNINTCWPGTIAFTYITVWNCGKFGNDAYYRFYSRECTRIANRRKERSAECKFRDNFIIKEEPGAIYFVVIGVDRVNNAEIQLALTYE